MNFAAQPPKAFPHVLRPRVGVRLPRQHQPRLGQLSQTTQSTSPCLPLACLLEFFYKCHESHAIQRAVLLSFFLYSDRAGSAQGKGWVKEKMVEPDSAGETLVLLGIIVFQADLQLHCLHKPTK